ncbi:hypothetical protein RchiOBHm_Chr4g0410101 [Rosa chinensis]|uniref:Uncharacterized protein n=1 Tax=Rosa chinensis TaxID=74649 RepID=A0A2P6QVA8_ROSCH|nr:hypothetical protein RchiOBHm_Chr4g0410101 [Rosa chinensis]
MLQFRAIADQFFAIQITISMLESRYDRSKASTSFLMLALSPDRHFFTLL